MACEFFMPYVIQLSILTRSPSDMSLELILFSLLLRLILIFSPECYKYLSSPCIYFPPFSMCMYSYKSGKTENVMPLLSVKMCLSPLCLQNKVNSPCFALPSHTKPLPQWICAFISLHLYPCSSFIRPILNVPSHIEFPHLLQRSGFFFSLSLSPKYKPSYPGLLGIL